MDIRSSLLDCVGNTPLVALDRFASKRDGCHGRVLGKLDLLNPYSVKDRAASTIILEAEKRGDITPGKTTILEATSGNTGIGLAMTCAIRGYDLILCMSEAMSEERKKILAALGARLELTPKIHHTKGAKARVLELRDEIEDSYYVCQHDNADNIQAHVNGTAEELWKQTDGKIAAFVAGLGTCGTLSGVSRTLREKGSDVCIIGVEPKEAPYYRTGHFEPHLIAGTVPGFTPHNYDPELVDEIFDVPGLVAYEAGRELAHSEGMLVGISSGATAWVAREIACRPEFKDRIVVAMIADSGERYLSVEGYLT
jgi:cysteine synthase A